MPLGYDQQTVVARGSGVDSLAMAAPQTVDAGDLLVVCLSTFFSAGTPETWTVTGSLNGAYTPAISEATPATAAACIGIFYKENSTAGSETVTIDPDGATADVNFTFSEVSGGQTSGALDNTATNVDGTALSNTPNVATGALDQADEIIFALMTYEGTDTTIAPDGTYIEIGEDENNSTGQAYNSQYKIVASTSSDTADWTLGGNFDWACCVATFKQAAVIPPIENAPEKLRIVSSPMIWR